jgi:hypothetical protein
MEDVDYKRPIERYLIILISNYIAFPARDFQSVNFAETDDRSER